LIIVDTGPLVALLDADDRHHKLCRTWLVANDEPLLVPALVVTETCYFIDRYYDPSTDQFLSVDPDVAETGQPYAFTGDDPLNATDPLGLRCLSRGVSGPCPGEPTGRTVARHRSTKLQVSTKPFGPLAATVRVIQHPNDSEGGNFTVTGGGNYLALAVVDEGGTNAGIFGVAGLDPETVSVCASGSCIDHSLSSGHSVFFRIPSNLASSVWGPAPAREGAIPEINAMPPAISYASYSFSMTFTSPFGFDVYNAVGAYSNGTIYNSSEQ